MVGRYAAATLSGQDPGNQHALAPVVVPEKRPSSILKHFPHSAAAALQRALAEQLGNDRRRPWPTETI